MKVVLVGFGGNEIRTVFFFGRSESPSSPQPAMKPGPRGGRGGG
jgi:hypothetical protein